MENQTNLFSFIQAFILIFLAPGFLGWINWWKATFTKRNRPVSTIFQPYRDIQKLLKVSPTHTLTTSWVFHWMPWILFLSYGSLIFSLPFLSAPVLKVDLLFVMYVLGLARFTLSLAGLDSASAFGGLGSNREMFFHFLTEVSLFAVIVATSLWTRSVHVFHKNFQNPMFYLALLCLAVAFFPVVLLEAGRIPVGNTETHLELTMAGKAVELEFSGHDLALIEWAEMIKLFFITGLWLRLIFPLQGSLSDFAIISIWWLVVGAGLAYWEQTTSKMRLGRIPSVAQVSLLFSFFAILLYLLNNLPKE